MLACLRARGLAARYVSGYLLTRPPPGQARLIGADASHAWVSLYCPENGWVDFDPTNDLLPDLEHITLAWGRDFSDVAAARVILGGGSHDPEVRVTVLPLRKQPADQVIGPAEALPPGTPGPFTQVVHSLAHAVWGQRSGAPANSRRRASFSRIRYGRCRAKGRSLPSGARGGSRTEPDSFLAHGERYG